MLLYFHGNFQLFTDFEIRLPGSIATSIPSRQSNTDFTEACKSLHACSKLPGILETTQCLKNTPLPLTGIALDITHSENH